MALYAMCRRVWSKRGTGGSREPESFTLQKQERQDKSEDLTDAAWISKQSILSFLKLAMKTLYGVDLTWHIWTEKLRFYLGQMTQMLVGVTGVENKYIYFILIWNIKTTDCRKWWHDAEGLPFPEKLPCSRCSRRRGTSPGPSHPLIQSIRE